jgi:antitoxin (DNA-binding transcriptional repressor) of toxin-antitoxin stability system
MQTIQTTDDGSNFHRILDAAERGESVVIMRNGKQIARLVPEVVIDRERVQQAIESILEIRKRTKPVSIEEILSMRDEGRM